MRDWCSKLRHRGRYACPLGNRYVSPGDAYIERQRYLAYSQIWRAAGFNSSNGSFRRVELTAITCEVGSIAGLRKRRLTGTRLLWPWRSEPARR